jgi:ankyrin repeat protein
MHTPCTNPEGPFATIPKELYITISDFLPELADLNAFTRTNKTIHALLNRTLYKNDAISPDPKALFWASTHNKPSTALLALNANTDPNSKTDKDPRLKGCTPILLASFHNSLAVLKLILLNDDANPNIRDYKWIRPPISWAAKQGHTEIVQTLLADPRTDVNLQDKSGDTALMICADHQPTMLTTLLLSGQADPRIANRHGWTPLSRAARDFNCEMGLLLARHLRLILDGDDSAKHCQHVFFYAAVRGHADVVEYLVKFFGEKLDPNADGERVGRAAFSYADGQRYGRGAFTIAAAAGNIDVVRILLGWEATDPNLQTHWKRQTPLFTAAEEGREDMVDLLVGCDRVGLEIADMHGTTPLGVAAYGNHEGIVRRLLSGPRKADPNARDENGQTPLFNAAFCGHLGVVKALLKAEGIDPGLGDTEGKTPVEVAMENQYYQVVEVLDNR